MFDHSRSIELRIHSIRQDYLENMMRIGGVKSRDNTSDILTKSLQPDLHLIHTRPLFPNRATLTPAELPKTISIISLVADLGIDRAALTALANKESGEQAVLAALDIRHRFQRQPEGTDVAA